MLRFLLTTLVTALGLLVVDLIVPGVDIASFPAAMLAAVAVGVINGSIRPVLAILSLPITIVTLGFFSLLVNGFCLWLASLFVPGFAVHGLLALIFGPIVLSFTSTLLNGYLLEQGLGAALIESRANQSIEPGRE
jgi:putative membrane protein